MSIPINYQREKIKKYFNLLVGEFITNPRHKNDISIVFQDYLENSKENSQTLGNTQQSGGGSETSTKTTITTINGVEVPGSERTTSTTTYFPYKYVISFLNSYKSEDELRGTVVHEFTHLYLYSTIGDHGHDDNFYSTMERLENWLNKNQGLSPRTDKSHDRDQYVGDNSSNANDKENNCPECSYPSPNHSPKYSHNQNNSRPTENENTTDPQEVTEFNQLCGLLRQSPDLATLEKNYQMVKGKPIYSDKSFIGEGNKLKNNDNKKTLDTLYQTQKWRLHNQLSLTNNNSSIPSKNENGTGNILWYVLAIGGIIFIGLIIYFAGGSKQSFRPNQRRRKI